MGIQILIKDGFRTDNLDSCDKKFQRLFMETAYRTHGAVKDANGNVRSFMVTCSKLDKSTLTSNLHSLS
jgi:hypothetical protein